MSSIDPSEAAGALVNLSALSAWMDSQKIPGVGIQGAELVSGGTQNILIRFQRGDRSIMLRRPPPHPVADGGKTILRETRVLSALSGTNVPHPDLIAVCADQSVIGANFYLMEAVDGFNATMGLPPAYVSNGEFQRRMGYSMIDGILALGNVDYEAADLRDFGRLDRYLERQPQRWADQLEAYHQYKEWPGPQALGDVGAVRDWLSKRVPSSFSAGIVHGDYHFANVMFQNDKPELSAIIDWELATIGDPLLDLGWLVATWPKKNGADSGAGVAIPNAFNLPSVSEVVDYYRSKTSRDMSDFAWRAVLACYKLGILQEGTFARACAGKAALDVGDLQHRRAIAVLESARAIMENPDELGTDV